ncbi:phospholipase D-like domain-containing protein [Acinetobacter baumannii]|uniref:hypothetical protein n=1 Tax=Acinetobacter baumannii TaxID=470 RepID=UPI0037572427
MKTINQDYKDYYIAIPFGYGTHELKIQKNNQWNVLDLIILRRISENNISLESLIAESNINRQLIIQIILPFIEEGWIILIQENDQILLEATPYGRLMATRNKLESSSKSHWHNRDYIVNLITGEYIGLHNSKSINLYNFLQINEFKKEITNFSHLDIAKNDNFVLDINKVNNAVIRDNEEIIIYKPPTSFLIEDIKYIIFNVRCYSKSTKINITFKQRFDNDDSPDISNLFSELFFEKLSIFLSNNITSINNLSKKNELDNKSYRELIPISHLPLEKQREYTYKLPSSKISVILGGEEHKQIFKDMIENSTDFLIIHSTFFGMWNLNDTLPLIEKAASRMVKVILLWGKDDFDSEDISNKEKENFKEIQETIYNLTNKYQGLIVLHDIQTGSHSKFILTNHNKLGYTCILGSCNWFFTQFDRYEASVRISSNTFVKDFLNIASMIATGRSYISNGITKLLNELNNTIENESKEPDENSVEIRLLLKDTHYEVLHLAQRAKTRLSILSDKASNVTDRVIWKGLSLCQAKIYAFYSTPAGNLSNNDFKEMGLKLKDINKNINFSMHNAQQRNHSKVLAWDKDHLVITSLNWLSSDASVITKDFDRHHELGIYINKDGIEQDFRRNFLSLNKR